MAVSFVRAVSDEEIQASDRLYADGVIGAEDRTIGRQSSKIHETGRLPSVTAAMV